MSNEGIQTEDYSSEEIHEGYKKTTSRALERYLTFSVGVEDYAIPLLRVKEVIAVPETTPLPYSPPYFTGIMNLRGQVISVLDIRKKLGVQPTKGIEENAVIIVDLDPIYVGVIVDSVNNVLLFSNDEFGYVPEMEHKRASEFLIGVAKKDDKLILLVEIEKILDVEDLMLAKKQVAA